MQAFKEFKVRMDQVKCEKYKTFQPELPTKKFIFSDEKESIHNMKILRDDSSDQNKATTVQGEPEPVEEIVEEVEEVKEEVRKAMTGMFRDKKRRIDLVIVVEDVTALDNIKLDFLSYIVRAGLEVELEPGTMEDHNNLLFIKIHAPDSVLDKFGKVFGTKRYFADTRYDYMDLNKKKGNYEKEWVMLVRNNYEPPNGYSNYERSIIVYKILLHLPFGDNANYYGIERLLNRRIVMDVFALHDGPYFITPEQTISGSNARQVLYYYWSRTENIFKQQPLHLIHEYFGPRLAFYFAFYEFFNKFLKVAAFMGILNICLGILNLTVLEEPMIKSICESFVRICDFCAYVICKKRTCKDYCLSIKIHLLLDHIAIPLYSFVTVVGAWTFLRLWHRREYFLKWFWEVGRHDSYYRNAVRPLFNTGSVRSDPFIGGLKYRDGIIPLLLRNVISKAIVILYWYGAVPIMYVTYSHYISFCHDLHIKGNYEKYRDYIVMALFQVWHTLIRTVIGKIYHYIVYFIVKYENHSSYKKYEESIVIKKMGFKMILQYAIIAFYAWLRGSHPRHIRCHVVSWSPYDTIRYTLYTLYGYKDKDICEYKQFCFPYSCIIEVSVLLGTLLLVTQVAYKVPGYIFNLNTDYNRSIYKNSDIPCWEREYRLISLTEEDMINRYLNLAAQFCLVTWFVIAFPLAAMILYIINVWNIRHEARKLLLASRRPLLIKSPGTGMKRLFNFIAIISILTNAINIASLTRSKLRYVMHELGKKPDELFKFYHYFYTDRPSRCYAPGQIDHDNKLLLEFYDIGAKIFFRTDYYSTFLYGLYHFAFFILAIGFFILIIRYTIPRQQDVEKARVAEEKVRDLFHHYEYEYKYQK